MRAHSGDGTAANGAAFGALDVLVLNARGIKSSSALRILRLLCVVECAGVRFKTRSRRSRNGPDWNASGTLAFRAPLEDESATEVRVSVWDKRGSGHKLMGSARVALTDCEVEETTTTTTGGMREMTLELRGGKFEGGTVRLNARYRRGEKEARDSFAANVNVADVEPGEAVEATGGTDLDESLESDFSGMISVDTSMTPMRGLGDGDGDEDDEDDDARGFDGSEDEDDEWRAALKPSRGRPETIPEQPTSPTSSEKEKGKPMTTRVHDNQMFDAWANDSAEDTVEVTPPPMPAQSKLNDALESPTSASRSAALRELHTVRHVKTPPRQPAAEAVPESPKRPASVPAKTTSPGRAKKIESEDDLVAALLSPGRRGGARVTFDERLNRTVPPPRRSPVAPASANSYPKSAVTKMMSPNNLQSVNSSALFAKKLFVEQSKFAAPAAPTRADIDEARRLATMFERADAVFASWSW